MLGFALLLVGARWWLIHHHGSPVPYWDQWDGEAATLYGPYVKGDLSWAMLFEPHNEHRILTTRLFALGLFIVNGSWNPLLQMVLNAVVIVGVLVLLLSYLNQALSQWQRWALLIFCLVLFCIPYAWENTLAGFQTQYYFNLLFSFIALWLLVGSPSFSKAWWIGLGFAILACLSLASGLFSLAATVPVTAAQCIWGQRRKGTGATAAMLLAALFVIGYALTPDVAQNAEMKAHSIMEFVHALKVGLSWPGKPQLLIATVLQIPAVAYLVLQWLRRREPVATVHWFLIALIVWVWGQDVSLAYGRSVLVRSSRYLDLYAIGLLVNFVCLMWSLGQARWRRAVRAAVCVIWVIYVAFAMYKQWGRIEEQLADKVANSMTELSNVRGYLKTGDKSFLFGKALLDIPYPRPDRLQGLLDDPAIRSTLPAAIMPAEDKPRHKGRLDALVQELLAHAFVAMLIGALALLAACVSRVRESNMPGVSRQSGKIE
ncbi:hypothetical protein CAL26_26125 [Bordetella genomosp. 9]|uniref:Uncharacterized protein n=1 Tax=Bordetella genomosp. 9 TaxID=1416803 RepID=A0A261R7F1_9BORD|nr:hypothetical protein CAL26_26125 [Bordetella genomosp. 9]